MKGLAAVELLIVVVVVIFLAIIPVSCHQSITRKQALMAKAGIDMAYWDIFWINPKVRFNQGNIVVEEKR